MTIDSCTEESNKSEDTVRPVLQFLYAKHTYRETQNYGNVLVPTSALALKVYIIRSLSCCFFFFYKYIVLLRLFIIQLYHIIIVSIAALPIAS